MSSTPQQQVNGPAIGLQVTAGISILFQLFGLLLSLGLFGAGLAGGGLPGADKGVAAMVMGGSMILRILGIVISAVIFIGATKMKNLQSYGFAMAAAILALIPCFACCLLGWPIGIWAIVVLVKPEVKAAFTQQ